MYSVQKFCGFLRSFFKKLLKARSPHAVPTYYDNLKSTASPCFLRALSVGAIRPKPRHKKLFGKSFLELQKLRQNKVMYSGKVLWLTFLRKKGKSVGNSLAYLSYKKDKSFFITATAKTYDEKRSNTKFIPL